MLSKILKAIDRNSEIKLAELIENVGENPNILWYPSAGLDFRDIIEAEERTEISPDLYFHTDYCRDVDIVVGTIFNDGRTIVEIIEINYLSCSDEINYHVSKNFASLPDLIFAKPRVLLCDVLVTYDGGQIRKPVLYWFFENINFLDEVLLKFNISISHIVKVCEGMAWGGNKESISICYAFLSRLRTKYLLIDNRVDFNLRLIRVIRGKHSIELRNFKLINIADRRNVRNWSHRCVAVMRVEILDQLYTTKKFNENLELISKIGLR